MDSWFFLSFSAMFISTVAGPEKAKSLCGEATLPPDSDPFREAEFGKNIANLSSQFAGKATRMSRQWIADV
jgi:hypothetical protein